MHIAIEASTWVNTRGYGRFTRELTRALVRADAGHELTLVLDSGAAGATDLPDVPRVVVPTRQAVTDAATASSARSPADLWRMGAALSSRRFDAVLFPTNYSFVPVLPGPYVIVIVHDALPETMPRVVLGSRRAEWLWRAKSRLACWRADLLATVSEASARAIRQHLPIAAGREIAILTEGTAPGFSAVPTPEDDRLVGEAAGRRGRFVLFVGGISPHKRVAELVRAFGQIAARPGAADLGLVLAGPGERDGFEVDQAGVDRAIREIGEPGTRVVRTGFVSDAALAALYRAAVCVVLPSTAEGFGLPALEAMASGTPLIAARNPALEEVCGPAAQYIERIEDLPAALSTVIADDRRRRELRDAGLERSRRFGWDEGARRLLAALERVPARRSRPW